MLLRDADERQSGELYPTRRGQAGHITLRLCGKLTGERLRSCQESQPNHLYSEVLSPPELQLLGKEPSEFSPKQD